MGRLQANKGVSLRGSKRETAAPVLVVQAQRERVFSISPEGPEELSLVRGSSGADSSLRNRRVGVRGTCLTLGAKFSSRNTSLHVPVCPKRGKKGDPFAFLLSVRLIL